MIRESGIVFTRNERRVFQEVAPLLHIAFDKNDADEERLFRTWNSLDDAGSPIPAKRLRGASTIAKALEDTIAEQSILDYWYEKAAEEGQSRDDLGDVENPRSGAYMCMVLAEAREGQLGVVRRARRLLDIALTETATHDLGDAVGVHV